MPLRFKQAWRLPYQFLAAIAGVVDKSLINPYNLCIGVSNYNAFMRFEGDGGNAQLVIKLFLRADVAEKGEKLAAIGLMVGDADLDIPQRAVLAPVGGFETVAFVGHHPGNVRFHFNGIFNRLQIKNRHRQQGFTTIPGLGDVGLIGVQQFAFQVNDQKTVQ